MKALEAKVLFELNKDGKLTVEVTGRKAAAKAGVLTIIEKMAELEEVTTAELLAEFQGIVKMRDENPIDTILANLFGIMNDDEEEMDEGGCDGDCDNCDRHAEMPQEVKDLLDRMFGGKK